MQNDAVSWLYTEVPKTFAPTKATFMMALNKVGQEFIDFILFINIVNHNSYWILFLFRSY